jgi:hypothetical protein
MTEQTPILTVTWDTVIGARTTGYGGPDEPPEVEPIDLGSLVVEHISRTLIEEVRRDIRTEVVKAVSPAIKAEVTAVVREALAGTVQRTNSWGQAEGEPATLRDLILAEVTAWLGEKPPRSGYNDREREGGFRALLRHEVTEALRNDLRETITAARADVAAKVRDSAAEIIGSVVKAQR